MTELEVGQIAEVSKQITDEDVQSFAKVSGDFNPVHLDEDYAQNTIFKGRIVHGVLSVGLISSVIANELPGPGSILIKQEVKYIAPVRINDTITARVEIIELLDKGKVLLSTRCLNQNEELVIDGTALVKVL